MLFYGALGRLDKRDRRGRIADIAAGQHGGDYAKKLLQDLAE